MPDGRPPDLPETAPIELREFIECKRASVTLTSGPLDWLPLPPDIKEYAPTPKLGLQPGASPGTGTISIDLMVTSFDLPVSLGGGELHIDASSLSSIPGAQEAIDTWVKDFNDWLKKNGKRLAQASIKDGSVTLVKEPIPVQPAAPPPAPPVPPVPPVTPVPPAGGGVGGNCALFGLLGLVLAGAIGVAWFTGIIPGLGGGGTASSAGPTASQGAVSSTSAGPSSSAGSQPVASASSSARPSSGAPVAPVAPPPEGAAPALDFLATYGGLTDEQLARIQWQTDSVGDFYLPVPGQAPTQDPPSIDMTGASAFLWSMDQQLAGSVTDHAVCATDAALPDGTAYRTGCNQTGPLTAGEYVIIITTHAAGYPTDFPAAGLHSWSVFTNPDNDPATGFTSTAPDNYLIGADTYLELLAFEDNTGAFQYYDLATRVADPVRTDTGERQGNLPTVARVVWFQDVGTQLWIIPKDDFGTNWYAGNFATTNRAANSPETLAADALFGVGDTDWLKSFPLATLDE